jgi:hypothetical protein
MLGIHWELDGNIQDPSAPSSKGGKKKKQTNWVYLGACCNSSLAEQNSQVYSFGLG